MSWSHDSFPLVSHCQPKSVEQVKIRTGADQTCKENSNQVLGAALFIPRYIDRGRLFPATTCISPARLKTRQSTPPQLSKPESDTAHTLCGPLNPRIGLSLPLFSPEWSLPVGLTHLSADLKSQRSQDILHRHSQRPYISHAIGPPQHHSNSF